MKERLLVDALADKVKVNVDTKYLVHGDSTQEMKKLESGSVDLVLTDPPFGIDLKMKHDDGWDKTGGGGQGGGDLAYASNYESFFLCHKGRRKLNRPGISNVFVYPRLAP